MEDYQFATMPDAKLYKETRDAWEHLKAPYLSETRKQQLHRKLTHGTYEILTRWQEIIDLEKDVEGE